MVVPDIKRKKRASTVSKLTVYRNRMKKHLDRLHQHLQSDMVIASLMSTYALTPGNKFDQVERTVYETTPSKAREMVNLDIKKRFNRDTVIDKYDQYLLVVASRFIKLMNINKKTCINKLLARSKIPRGINKINFPAYVIMFYYVSFIDTHAHDYAGVLLILKHFARCVCNIHLVEPIDVLSSILMSMKYNILCRSGKQLEFKKSKSHVIDPKNAALKLNMKSAMERLNKKLITGHC